MSKANLTLQTGTETIDNEGIATKNWSDAATLRGTALPMGQALALKAYGFEDPVKYRFFFKGKNDDIEIGNRCILNDEILYIVYIANYGKVIDILLDKQMPVGGK